MNVNQADGDRPEPYATASWLYRRQDWVGVIPIEGKWPPPKGWTGADGDWPSGPDIQTWCDTRADFNVALRLPPNVLGIDVDHYSDKRGKTTLAECEAEWGPLPDSWRSTSRVDETSGIRLFTIPEGLAWPGQLPGGGVELIRWDHRYCMCWPSVHPETGRTYRWTNAGLSTIGIPNASDLPALPQAWVDGLVRGVYIHEAKARLGVGDAATWLTELDGSSEPPCSLMARRTKRLHREMVEHTSRHETALTGVLDLVRRAEEGHPGILTALSSTGETFVQKVTADDTRNTAAAWGEWSRLLQGAVALVLGGPLSPQLGDPCVVLSDPPWRPGDPLPERRRRTDTSAPLVQSGAGGAAQNDAPARGSDPVGERLNWLRADRDARILLAAENAPGNDEIPGALNAMHWMAEPDEILVSRIQGILPVGARIVLAAQQKAGKTTFVGNLVRSLVDGVPFLGMYPVSPPTGVVTLLDNEMNPATLKRWLRDMDIENLSALRVIPMIGRTNTFDIRVPRIFEYWVRILREMGTTILIVDCLKPILDELALNEHTETGMITTPLTRLKIAADISELILVHHMGHSGERSRGDSALRGWPEAEWQLVRQSENGDEPEADALRYFKAYGRDVDIPEAQLLYDAASRRLSLLGGTRKQAQEGARDAEMEALVLGEVRLHPGCSGANVTQALVESGNRFRRGKELRALGRLMEQNLIRMVDNGPGRSKDYYPNIVTLPHPPRSIPGEATPTPPPKPHP